MARGTLLFPVGYAPLDNGAVVPGGLLYFYRTGTTTAQNTYSDSALTTANANPVVLNSEGYLDVKVYGDPGSGFDYRVRLADSADTQIWQSDDVRADGSGGTTTVASLPTGTAGLRSFVSDATATTFASVVAGGGANGVPVYHDGTNWRIG